MFVPLVVGANQPFKLIAPKPGGRNLHMKRYGTIHMVDNTEQTIDNADSKRSMWDRPLVYIERITDKAQYDFALSLVADFVDDFHINLSLIQERNWVVVPGETSNHFSHEDAALLSQALHTIDCFECLAIPVRPGGINCYRIPTSEAGLIEFGDECGHFDYVLTDENLSFLIFCNVEYILFAGQADFVTKAVGTSIQTARREFFEFADDNDYLHQFYLSLCDRYKPFNGTLRKTDQLGYIDKTGSFVIPPQFDYCLGHTEGLAVVSVEGKYGYIDTKGDFVVAPQFEEASRFSEGLAAVGIDDRLGYIDNRGAMVIQPEFIRAEEFSEGLAYVNGEYINRTGQWILMAEAPEVWYMSSFSEGLAWVVGRDGPGRSAPYVSGYIDKTGELAIPLQFVHAADFSCGLARVNAGRAGEWQFIDKTGTITLELAFDFVSLYFFEGLVAVLSHGKYGFADKTGNLVISPQFDQASGFSEGVAAVKIDGKYGYVDKRGEWVIEPQYMWADRFSNGLAPACL